MAGKGKVEKLVQGNMFGDTSHLADIGMVRKKKKTDTEAKTTVEERKQMKEYTPIVPRLPGVAGVSHVKDND